MHEDPPYEAETHGVVVRVRPAFLAGQSDPAAGRWVWAYQVEIENRRPDTVQLLTRRWTITDGHGRVEQVEGPGVVGEQPVLGPGERHSYASGCPLPTPTGMMVGAYVFVDAGGATFEADIPAFSLDTPDARARPN
ncbi:Co2+/Mg2+ efflux protein ApaG [Brevundimonas sp.]|jgi:ApaG protein|uniref:Co2+/Mg2+ efflux protein ApaG n=2 Tax=Brevundimonas sp. TaxID=1871086 RepID=UPI0022C02CF7|nr:Co2+/Mg2+ efflux protein ApaG [Brevundimonas sp.]MCZ8085887.1 Co2+/Mg2+ efflux protein ApaG [Brevundimonas sp.]MCZ8194846.1 Co2+/Mg2+ efflux protein ApaG [Brevundimonas sp.]